MKLPVKRWAYPPESDYFGFLDQLPVRSDDNSIEGDSKFKMSDAAPSVRKRMASSAFETEGREYGEMFREGGGLNFAQQHWSHIVFASLLAVVALAAVGVREEHMGFIH